MMGVGASVAIKMVMVVYGEAHHSGLMDRTNMANLDENAST